MSCKGCRAKIKPHKFKCQTCGAIATDGSKSFNRFWMRCPTCISGTRYMCGKCLIRYGYVEKGKAKKPTRKYTTTLSQTLFLGKDYDV
jgi:hypothetical protein